MAIDAIGGTVGAGGGGDIQRAGVDQEDFIRLFLTQLSFQDPLEPVDNREFLAQLAQFTAVQQFQTVNENIDALLNVQGSSQAVSLIGRTVEVTVQGGSEVGQVTTLRFNSGRPLLTILQSDGTILQDVSPAQVVLVR